MSLVAATIIAMTGCDRIATTVNPPVDATLVLFDVSSSTQDPAIRKRYLEAFDGVLETLNEEGGYIAADIIDDNPQAHSSFPIDDKIAPCGLLDNSLECEQETEDVLRTLPTRAKKAYFDTQTQGTDILGALENAEDFLNRQSVDDARNVRVVLLSDMVQSHKPL